MIGNKCWIWEWACGPENGAEGSGMCGEGFQKVMVMTVWGA